MVPESWRVFEDMGCVPLLKPQSKEGANGMQTEMGRELVTFPTVSYGSPSSFPLGKRLLVKSKTRGGFWGHPALHLKVVIDEGQKARAFTESSLGCWLLFPDWCQAN